jgi:DHA2 family multidrug resistance protein
MTSAVAATPDRDKPATGYLLVAGVVLATLTEAIAGTVLALGRSHIGGDAHATPDEAAWLDIGYTSLKLIGYMVAPWLMTRINPHRLIIAATLVMGTACGIAAITTRLDLLIALRVIQGFSGGTLLVGGQAIIFLAYPLSRQPILQALFAMGSVVAPATIAPALQGWLIDSQSWTWIFFSIVPIALAAAGLLLIADCPKPAPTTRRPFDWIGFALISVALFCLTYVFSQGSRWNWFDEPRIVWLTAIGAAALLAFLGQQVMAKGRGLLDFTLFRSEDFCFAFIVSFVAGAALFGSAFLIPAFAVSVLAFTHRCRPAAVAKRRALHRLAPDSRLPDAGPERSSGRHGAVRNPADHGCDVDAVRLDQRKRRPRHDGGHPAARLWPRLPVSVDHADRLQQFE